VYPIVNESKRKAYNYCQNETTNENMPVPDALKSFTGVNKDSVVVPEKGISSLFSVHNDPVSNNSDTTFITLFEQQVHAAPNAIAFICDDTETTYKELNEQANQVAHFLKKNGLKKESCIPVCIDRTVKMIATILGILKAGGVYVPIDPEYPQKRIEYQVIDVNASIIITDRKSRNKLPSIQNVTIIDLDTSWEAICKEPVENFQTEINLHQLAYIIYTSGSTGQPKGVMIEHNSLYSFVNWCSQEFASTQFDIVYAVTSICFDLSVYEIFYPLCIGKKIRLMKSALDIENYLYKDKSVLLNTVPTMIDSLLKRNLDLSNVTAINVAGEPVPHHLVQNIDSDKIEVRNLYGPTEDTTYSTVYRLKKDQPILIGKPINGTSIYILNAQLQPVPIGEEGEIFIAGDGLARGYLNQEELTKEKFIKDPFNNSHKARMYKTGDLGRWTEDDNIEFLGRIDHQIKIKGFRIETGEIEHSIEQSGFVERAIVTGDADKNGNKRIVAYVIPNKNYNREATISYVKERLPHFMMPSFLIEIEQVPLTENGKIDRKRLPSSEDIFSNLYHEAPRNSTEEVIVDIWQTLLGVDEIGIHDNFFDLGGDSILSMQFISKVREMDFLLQPMDIFQHPTIAELAEIVESRSEKRNVFPLGSIVPFRREGSYAPFFALPGFWMYRKLALYLNEERPFFGFEPYEYTDVKVIADDLIRAMKKEQPKGPYLLGGFCENYPVVFETAHKLLEQGEEVPLLVLIESHAPYSALSLKSRRFIARKINLYYQNMKGLSAGKKLAYVIKELKYISTVMYSKLRKKKKHPPRTYPGNLLLIRSSIIPPSYSDDPKMGWQPYVTGNIETITIQGDHFGILEEPGVIETADKLHSMLIKYAG
jgi:amino acid adenylation domain-containing protein